jgi:hypothetical protein
MSEDYLVVKLKKRVEVLEECLVMLATELYGNMLSFDFIEEIKKKIREGK